MLQRAGEYHIMYLINDAKQNFGDAKKYILEAYDLNPKNPQILLAVASLKGREGKFKLALHHLNQAIYLKPDYANAYSNRGVVKGALGDTKGAIRDFTRAIKIDKYNSFAYQNRGISFEIVGDLKNACRDWKTASLLGLGIQRSGYLDNAKKIHPLGVEEQTFGDDSGSNDGVCCLTTKSLHEARCSTGLTLIRKRRCGQA